ncbi:MAG: DNA mismatch repair protein MutS [Oceanihabitans sediminis]|nr:DNA mismatch repair protein MutS [Oceanihabitans sediminis]MDX1773575.1 DNA mismatch repair protein MutS [Oceanihabitans sediminis]
MIHFKIGDKVQVLDEDFSGKITAISGDNITIITEDGFDLDFHKKELILIGDASDLDRNVFQDASVRSIISEKEAKSRHALAAANKRKAKERYEPTMEIDLHIHQLTDSYKGMSSHDMLTLQLDTARRQLEFAIKKRIQKVVFIHGVGEGVLKLELEYLFGRYPVKFYAANYQKYGLGATEVYIYQNVKS